MSLLLANRALIKPSAGTNSFILSINTSLGDATAAFDLRDILPDGETYNFTVYHNGTSTSYTGTTPSTESSLDLAMPASSISQIEFEGKVGGWSVNNVASDRLKIVSVDQWGDVGFNSLLYGFWGCDNLVSVAGGLQLQYLTNTSLRGMFRRCINLTSLDVSDWDMSYVSNVSYFIYECRKLPTINTSNWDTSNFTDIGFFAYECFELTVLDVSSWDVSGCANSNSFARFARKLAVLDVSNWDVSNFTQTLSMVDGCWVLTTFDTSNWDTSNISNCSNMCNDCFALTSSFDDTLWWNRTIPIAAYANCFTDCLNISNYASIPFDWKGMVEVGTLTTDQSTLQQVGIELSGSSVEIYWDDGTYVRITNGVENLKDYSSTGTYNIKLAAFSDSAITILKAEDAKLTSITGLKTGLLTALQLQDNNISGTLDLSDAPISGTLITHSNPNLTGITFASTGNGQLNNTQLRGCDLTGTLDLSNVPIRGLFYAYSNPNLTGITFSTTGNAVVTNFRAYLCDLTGTLDLSNVPVSGTFWNYSNANLTGITFASIGNNTITYTLLNNCGLSSLDFSNVPISSILNIQNNSNLSSLTFASTGNGTVTSFAAWNCNLSSIDCSNLPISTSFRVYGNSSLSSLTLASTGNGGLTQFSINGCDLPNIDFSVFGSSDGVAIDMDTNNFTATEHDNQLINLDNTGWINGSLDIVTGNTARTSASDTAYNNLTITDNWTIT